MSKSLTFILSGIAATFSLASAGRAAIIPVSRVLHITADMHYGGGGFGGSYTSPDVTVGSVFGAYSNQASYTAEDLSTGAGHVDSDIEPAHMSFGAGSTEQFGQGNHPFGGSRGTVTAIIQLSSPQDFLATISGTDAQSDGATIYNSANTLVYARYGQSEVDFPLTLPADTYTMYFTWDGYFSFGIWHLGGGSFSLQAVPEPAIGAVFSLCAFGLRRRRN